MKYITFRRIVSSSLFVSYAALHATALSLNDAIEVLKTQNLEIKAASLDAQSAQRDLKIAQGHSYGSLDFTQTASRSNDAGNVFGFKLSSREAAFGDFGFAQFDNSNPNILTLQPKDLNYPGYQNFHQSKLTYSLPLYTGGKLIGYEKIAAQM
ncbi:MAG: TolC family protein [Sulfuricurvum sp.]|nr:TolC family protein [Sulfuricurvum sp.]